MKNVFALFAVFVLAAGAAFAQTAAKTNQTAVKISQSAAQPDAGLVSQLPASEFVVTMNFKRLLSEVVPQILANDTAALNKINAGIDEFKGKSGIDLRQFEQAAIGLNYKQLNSGEIDLEPTLLLRGAFNPTALIGAAKIALNGKFRQEQIAGKSVTVFSIPEAVKKPGTAPTTNKRDAVERALDRLMSGEVAITTLDSNTLAVGKPAQIRTLLAPAATNRVSKDFADYISRNPNAVMNFAGKVPPGLTSKIETGNDQISKVISSLQKLYATVDTNGSDASLALIAETLNADQAAELSEILQVLQSFGKNALGSKTDPKNQALARLVESLKITQNANQVQLDALVTPDISSAIIR